MIRRNIVEHPEARFLHAQRGGQASHRLHLHRGDVAFDHGGDRRELDDPLALVRLGDDLRHFPERDLRQRADVGFDPMQLAHHFDEPALGGSDRAVARHHTAERAQRVGGFRLVQNHQIHLNPRFVRADARAISNGRANGADPPQVPLS